MSPKSAVVLAWIAYGIAVLLASPPIMSAAAFFMGWAIYLKIGTKAS